MRLRFACSECGQLFFVDNWPPEVVRDIQQRARESRCSFNDQVGKIPCPACAVNIYEAFEIQA